MTGIVVSVIVVAIITMLVTRPGTAEAFNRLSHFVAASIQALLGADSE